MLAASLHVAHACNTAFSKTKFQHLAYLGSLAFLVVVQEPEQQEHLVPLSERFRLAYVSRAERIAAKAERNYQQRKRRELRNNTVLQALARFKFL